MCGICILGLMLDFCFTATLKQIQSTLEDKKSRDETKKQLESCPLRVEELDRPDHLLIEVTVLHTWALSYSNRKYSHQLLHPDVV
jgi:hypothetical protein